MELTKNHYIGLANGRFATTNADDLKSLFENMSADPKAQKLLLYFHGGLVSEQAGMEIASGLLPIFSEAGAYPVFFIWQAGISEILLNNIQDIFRERIFQTLKEKVLQYALGKLQQSNGERAVGLIRPESAINVQTEILTPTNGQEPYRHIDPSTLPGPGPLTEQEKKQFETALLLDPVLTVETRSIVSAPAGNTRSALPVTSVHTLMSDDIVEELRAEAANPGERGGLLPIALLKHGVAILVRVVERFAASRDHGVYPTVIEELLRELYLDRVGKLFWDETKKDTADAFGTDPDCGGTAFCAALKEKLAAGASPRIILVGHSTGAVYINELLKHFVPLLDAEPKLKDVTFDIIFLAPACTIAAFEETRKAYGHRIHGLRIFAMHDALETQDACIPLLYTRSLLYLVSGVAEGEADTPLLGMERFFSGKAPYSDAVTLSARSFLLDDLTRNRFVWSKAANGDGLSSASTSHGGFDDDATTRLSMQNIIGRGF